MIKLYIPLQSAAQLGQIHQQAAFYFTVILHLSFFEPILAVTVAVPALTPLIFTEFFLTETNFATFLLDVVQVNFFVAFFKVNVKDFPTIKVFLVLLSLGEAALNVTIDENKTAVITHRAIRDLESFFILTEIPL